MIEVINLSENQELLLNDDELEEFVIFLEQNNSLPIRLIDNTLVFDEYTIGSIQINNRLINIIPRNNAVDLTVVFDMLMYLKDIRSYSKTSGFEKSIFGMAQIIPETFLNNVQNLIDFGITGTIISNETTGFSLNGELIHESYNKRLIPINGISYKQISFTTDVYANQIIRLALERIYKLNLSEKINKKTRELLSSFEFIDDFQQEIISMDEIIKTFYSTNPFYPQTLEMAYIIINNLRISYGNGDLQFYSFLINSNILFEDYVRKLTDELLAFNVEKWRYYRNFAVLKFNNDKSYKSFVPDIVVGYNSDYNTALGVFDVKNKYFEPDLTSLGEVVTNQDLYQILFYLRQLKSRFGILIFPTSKFYDAIRMEVLDDGDKYIYLIGINMRTSHYERMEHYKSLLNEYFLKKL